MRHSLEVNFFVVRRELLGVTLEVVRGSMPRRSHGWWCAAPLPLPLACASACWLPARAMVRGPAPALPLRASACEISRVRELLSAVPVLARRGAAMSFGAARRVTQLTQERNQMETTSCGPKDRPSKAVTWGFEGWKCSSAFAYTSDLLYRSRREAPRKIIWRRNGKVSEG